MPKPLYYVPCLLIVEAEDRDEADSVAERILTGLSHLEVGGMSGNMLITGAESTPASHNWEYKDQIICTEDGRIWIEEGA